MEHVPLLQWMRDELETHIPQEMKYRQAAIDQMCFFRDRITRLFTHKDMDYEKVQMMCKIASWHTSKSIRLPVYYFSIPGLEVYARDNFYNWNVSIRSHKKVQFPEYFNVDAGEGYLFMEGMEAWKYPPHGKNKEEFSICIGGDYELHSVMWYLASQFKEEIHKQ